MKSICLKNSWIMVIFLATLWACHEEYFPPLTPASKEEFIWDNTFWQELKTDSLFQCLGNLVNSDYRKKKLDSLQKHSTSDDIYFEKSNILMQSWIEQSQELNQKLNQRFPLYSYHYAVYLADSLSKQVATSRVDVIGDCSISITKYRDVLWKMNTVLDGLNNYVPYYGYHTLFVIFELSVKNAHRFFTNYVNGRAWIHIEETILRGTYNFPSCGHVGDFSLLLKERNIYLTDFCREFEYVLSRYYADPYNFYNAGYLESIGCPLPKPGMPPPSEGVGSPAPSQVGTGPIKKATEKAVATVIQKYGTEDPHCNAGVQEAFNQLFNTNELDNMRANDIVDYWKNHPERWKEVQLANTQELANEGFFVVAGWKNPIAGKSGHVVVIVPGAEANSLTWKCRVPCTMDTGFRMRNPKQKLSDSFGSSIKPNVKYYKYQK